MASWENLPCSIGFLHLQIWSIFQPAMSVYHVFNREIYRGTQEPFLWCVGAFVCMVVEYWWLALCGERTVNFADFVHQMEMFEGNKSCWYFFTPSKIDMFKTIVELDGR